MPKVTKEVKGGAGTQTQVCLCSIDARNPDPTPGLLAPEQRGHLQPWRQPWFLHQGVEGVMGLPLPPPACLGDCTGRGEASLDGFAGRTWCVCLTELANGSHGADSSSLQ